MIMRYKEEPAVLFTDEQIRRFIVDGYVVFKPDLPDAIHEEIRRKLNIIFENEANPGNNILPRVPEMDAVLNSPEVRGSLISILGEDYFEHPHRFCHYTGPLQDHSRPKRTLAQMCHQDSYTPLGRSRQHFSRFARIIYYPQDSPIELGPTHVIPGTQYHRALSDADRSRAIPLAGPAGTVAITHFDVGHAAGINEVNQHRHMIKFIYFRGKTPEKPSWNCRSSRWENPAEVQTTYQLDQLWSHMWNWMCGRADGSGSARGKFSKNGDPSKSLSYLNSDCQQSQLNAIYALGSVGPRAIAPLVDALRASAKRDGGVLERWNEGAVAMDGAAFALTAAGVDAVPVLSRLLQDKSEWVRINAAFALGELDAVAVDAVPALERCLHDTSHRVVRTATDSLGSIRERALEFMPALGRLLKVERPEWSEVLTRGFTANDQVRFNAATTFCRLGKVSTDWEDGLIRALEDRCGQVAAMAMLALERIASPVAQAAVLSYLKSRRWDESLTRTSLF